MVAQALDLSGLRGTAQNVEPAVALNPCDLSRAAPSSPRELLDLLDAYVDMCHKFVERCPEALAALHIQGLWQQLFTEVIPVPEAALPPHRRVWRADSEYENPRSTPWFTRGLSGGLQLHLAGRLADALHWYSAAVRVLDRGANLVSAPHDMAPRSLVAAAVFVLADALLRVQDDSCCCTGLLLCDGGWHLTEP